MKLLIDNNQINIEVDVADTALRRIVGLIGRPKDYGRALLLKPCNSIHMFFMRFAVDAVFIDKNNKVIKILPNLRPWRISPIVFNAAAVLELPEGCAARFGIKKGSNLVFS